MPDSMIISTNEKENFENERGGEVRLHNNGATYPVTRA